MAGAAEGWSGMFVYSIKTSKKQILSMLEAPKRIGLSMTESSMLTPVKSVTAVIGVSAEQEPCHRKGCEACEKKDCIYRRNEG